MAKHELVFVKGLAISYIAVWLQLKNEHKNGMVFFITAYSTSSFLM